MNNLEAVNVERLKVKKQIQSEIPSDVKAFIDKGGIIQNIPYGVTGEEWVGYNNEQRKDITEK